MQLRGSRERRMQIAALKRMSPEARSLKASELSRLADELFLSCMGCGEGSP